MNSSTVASTAAGDHVRFEFGKNWQHFLSVLNDARITQAEASLRTMLGVEHLNGQRFLDIGCGSGLFSLAARRLGAIVTSFDFDPQSVACTSELRRRYLGGDPTWVIGQGSVLDADFMRSLGTFDIVYSWGVLHHTGAMWSALERAADAVADGGRLFIALYNDQGAPSVWWTRVKRTYNQLPRALKPVYMLLFGAALEAAAVGVAVGRGQPRALVDRWTNYQNLRGMSRWHDIVDWVGGYPFEVAAPDAVFRFCRDRGLALTNLKTCGGKLGCNEFVFERAR